MDLLIVHARKTGDRLPYVDHPTWSPAQGGLGTAVIWGGCPRHIGRYQQSFARRLSLLPLAPSLEVFKASLAGALRDLI